jgi:hypothetical protein
MAAKTGAAVIIRKTKLRYPEMSEKQIARRVGCNPSNVHAVLSRFLGKRSEAELRDFQANQADCFEAKAYQCLDSVTPAKLAKAPAVSLITGAAILIDKARLVRGQATSINLTAVMDLVELLKARQRQD